jgi:hypothetical protein
MAPADDASYGDIDFPGDPDNALSYSVILHYDPMMVAELAMGADAPHEIAERYGVDLADFEHLSRQEWFQRLVANKRTEFHDQGVLFTAKAGMMAEALLTRLFQQSMNGSIPAPLTVEVAKQLTDIGRLKPQPLNTTPGAAGGSFQINIQVNGADVTKPEARLVPAPASSSSPMANGDRGGRATPGDPNTGVAMALDFNPKGTPPASLSNLKVPGFDTRHPGQVSALGSLGAVPLPPTPKPV